MRELLIQNIHEAIEQLKQAGTLTTTAVQIQIDPTRDKKFGDFASNIALLLAKANQSKPRDLAEKIVAQLPQSKFIEKIEIAGPGFINFFIGDQAFQNIVAEILKLKTDFGRANIGQGSRLHLEFVSCNPTGPLHVGHGRGAAYGASLANLLELIGYQVHREYYVNDAGRQMDILTVSIWLRYLELYGAKITFPVAGYKGAYVIQIAKQLKEKYGDLFHYEYNEVYQNLPPDALTDGSGDKEAYIDALVRRAKKLLGSDDYQTIFAFGLQDILDDIRQDLAEFGVHFQTWFHESSLFKTGALERGIALLEEKNQLYKKDNAVWFKATSFGDEKDRVVIRENGTPTYFASDIAYHFNKFERGFNRAIDVFGADHHGYAPRVKAFLQAVGLDPNNLLVLLVQFAILYRGHEKVQMSTRSGEFVTLRELRQEVGNDAARFFYIMRKAEQHLDFDLELAKAQSNDNPVYYIQYAHARICSVFRQLGVKNWSWDQSEGLASLTQLNTQHEQDLLRCLARYPDLIVDAATHHEPHLLAHYLQELANYFHTYYNAQQFLIDDISLRNARLCLIAATQQVLANGLQILGVSAPETM